MDSDVEVKISYLYIQFRLYKLVERQKSLTAFHLTSLNAQVQKNKTEDALFHHNLLLPL
jgi:hypothetical protein